jgi:hypothetical protein
MPGWVLIAVLQARRTATGEQISEGKLGAAKALLRRRGRVNGAPVWQLLVRPRHRPSARIRIRPQNHPRICIAPASVLDMGRKLVFFQHFRL